MRMSVIRTIMAGYLDCRVLTERKVSELFASLDHLPLFDGRSDTAHHC